MRKVALVLILVMIRVIGCSSAAISDLTMDDFIGAYQAEGVEVDPNEKPEYAMIDAVDGVIFYVDNQYVAIYEFQNKKTLDQLLESHPSFSKDTPTNGLFMLETNNQQATEIFNNVE